VTDNYLHFVIVYTNKITPRLQYITDFIGKKICGKAFLLTSDAENYRQYTGPKINYSKNRIDNNELLIINYSLLIEDSIKQQTINCFEVNNFKAFFKVLSLYEG